MLGRITREDLASKWGDAAADAQALADAVTRRADTLDARLVDISWEIVSCRVLGYPAEGVVELQTAERWDYRAILACRPEGAVRSTEYPSEYYRMASAESGWVISDWRLGPQVDRSDWTCP